MTLDLSISTEREDFQPRPRLGRIYRGFIAAWLIFEIRFSR